MTYYKYKENVGYLKSFSAQVFVHTNGILLN